MEKVKLTQKQADAITKNVNEDLKNGDILYRYLRFDGYDEQFRGLTFSTLADALYIGYEVESDYKIGDWVKDTSTNAVIQIADKQQKNNFLDPRHKTIRHATKEEIAEEKQRRWWAKHGREVWKLREGDLLIAEKEPDYADVVHANGDFNIHFKDGNYFSKAYIKENYKVVCFAENRMDVK